MSWWRAILVAGVVNARPRTSMDCGTGVKLCGVLTLESGLGSGEYEHDLPCVHGLWPEDGSYGELLRDSECLAPDSTADPTVVYECYVSSGDDDADIISFEVHEWEKHGECAGVEDQEDYFTQICDMASDPVAIMTKTRLSGGDIYAMNDAVVAAGYEVYDVDEDDAQLLLSACSTPERTWMLSAVADFPTNCGGWDDEVTDDGDDGTDDESCVPNEHGPPCDSDDDCVGVTDCVRCAHSGYCTDVPLVALNVTSPVAKKSTN
ncbi:hypothetical protein CTAYLR_007077 [Chrysophaeum taylorii]|uniref:Uncharacterized protein n=1 Tax=Chrysophaeum taylorii TaxID=2483200 RepID=A0AAD7UM26_9STRA|nr:hypothetical protein CTAYLR_007077 [Chrysophaeum taylorii]